MLSTYARVIIVGVGGGGCHAVARIIQEGLAGAEYVAADTDHAHLHHRHADVLRPIRLNTPIHRGIGCGGNPNFGAMAAEAAEQELRDAFRDADMVLLIVALGGATGSGAAPVIARIAREEAALTVALVTMPFAFEGRRRRQVAEEAAVALRAESDSVIVVPNDGLLYIIGNQTLWGALDTVNWLLYRTIRAICEVLTPSGLITFDFSDLRAVAGNSGWGALGIGYGVGEGRATIATMAAMASPTLGDSVQPGGTGLLVLRGGPDLGLLEVNEAMDVLHVATGWEATFPCGINVDPRMVGEIEVVLLATGIPAAPKPVAPRADLVAAYSGLVRSRREAAERAEQLVRSLLSDQEYDAMHRLGYLEVKSPTHSGRVYRVPLQSGYVEVLESGRCVARLCVMPMEPVPEQERVLVHKLMIEGCEEEYLRVANRL